MLKRAFVVLALLACQSVSIHAEEAASSAPMLLSLTLTPSLTVPLGRDAPYYNPGFGAEISADYRMPFLPLLFMSGSACYSLVPLEAVTSLSLLSGGLGTGIRLDIGKLSVRTVATAGYFYGFLNDGSLAGGANPVATGGASLSWAFTPSFSAGLGAAYRYFFGLYNDLSIRLGGSYSLLPARALAARPPAKPRVEKQPLPAKPEPMEEKPIEAKPEKGQAQPEKPALLAGAGLEISSVEFFNVFPVFFKYYSGHALGRIVVKNSDTTAATDVKAGFSVKQYMDNPSYSTALASLAPGEEKQIELFGLLKSNILEISEPTLVSSNITLEYAQGGARQKKEITRNVRIQDRNALTWEDDRGAAAFVTAKDPTVLKFSKNVSAMLSTRANKAVNKNLFAAMGIHEALRAVGLAYVVDPARPFDRMYQNKSAIDFLQFPAQTLEYKAGDCDDLAILYCALLESQSVSTAFITVPGHVFMAFSLNMNPEDARKAFLRPDELVYTEDGAWVPVEVTERKGDFLKAWETGAKEWRENQARGLAKLHPVNDCWQTYEPVGFSGTTVSIAMPQEEAVVKACLADVSTFITREIYPQVASLQAEIKKSQDPTKPTNRLGVLYAQHGILDLAEQQFAKLAEKDYVPALINMGCIWYARSEPRKALGYYQRALAREPTNAKALLYIARVNHDLENYGEVKVAYEALTQLDPTLAAQFGYLDLRGEEATRAANLSQAKELMFWEAEK
jgi:tetratricopeptide (TPR) repeat protein